MYNRSQRRHEKSPDLCAKYECAAKCYHVFVCFACWLRKHDRQKQSVQIRWRILHTLFRVCHRKSTPVCGSRNADKMYVYCTAHFCYTRFRTGLRGKQIAGNLIAGVEMSCLVPLIRGFARSCKCVCCMGYFHEITIFY